MLTPAVFQAVGCAGGPHDDLEMRMTGIFGLFPMTTQSSTAPDLVIPRGNEPAELDERVVIWFPKRQMVTDGLGRRVAAENAVRLPREWPL